MFVCLFVFGTTASQWARTSSFMRFVDHTWRCTTVGRTSLDEWSARRRDLYLTTHNIYNTRTSMPLVGFKPTISAGERPQTYALDRVATGTGTVGSVQQTNCSSSTNRTQVSLVYWWLALNNANDLETGSMKIKKPDNQLPQTSTMRHNFLLYLLWWKQNTV